MMTDEIPTKPAAARLAPLREAFAGLRRIGRDIPEVDSFALVAFSPVPLIVLGALAGGIFPWLALFWIAGAIFALDRLVARAAPDAPEGSEFPAADRLSIALAVTHFALLLLVVAALSGLTHIGPAARLALLLATGLYFGQVSNANAHELIHRADKRLFVLGKWVYVSLLYGHHTSAHRLVHHRFVATPDDPNTATLGEGFWSFAPRAWIGGFTAGWEMEQARLSARAEARAKPETPASEPEARPDLPDLPTRLRTRLSGINPYFSYVLGGLWFVALFAVLFGWAGVLGYLLLCAYAQMQILLADYVQHYGLMRKRLDEERYTPVTAAHSWDAPDPVSSLFMLNAPRHSDHHAHPARPYPALRLGDTEAPGRPILPRSLPAMAALALFPPAWHRVMDHRVLALRKGTA